MSHEMAGGVIAVASATRMGVQSKGGFCFGMDRTVRRQTVGFSYEYREEVA